MSYIEDENIELEFQVAEIKEQQGEETDEGIY